VVAHEIFTVGHSNLSADAFFAILERGGVRGLADVRLIPASRRHPHFAREALSGACSVRGIRYDWMRDLGGRRRPSRDSPHTAWQVDAFRGYADYAETEPFASALAALEAEAKARPTAVMCAEAKWWQCHRRLISDHLLVRGWRVLHLMGSGEPRPHALSEIARIEKSRIVYDVGTNGALDLGAKRAEKPDTRERTRGEPGSASEGRGAATRRSRAFARSALDGRGR
jgi:uncharacterized protein (DUF488 family)